MNLLSPGVHIFSKEKDRDTPCLKVIETLSSSARTGVIGEGVTRSVRVPVDLSAQKADQRGRGVHK